jgi:flavin-dependent dehydrogenase
MTPSSSSTREVVVVGGGPAGAATALALARRGIGCTLLERSDYRSFRVGETLSATGVATLRKLGTDTEFLTREHLPSFAIRSSWGSEALHERSALLTPTGLGFHLERRRFDRSLSEQCEAAGVEVRREAQVTGSHAEGAGFRLTVREASGTSSLAARLVVDASGRSLSVARRSGARWLGFDRTLALFALLDREHLPEAGREEQVLLLEAVEAGFWYSAPVPGNRLLLALLTDLDLFRARTGSTGERVRAALTETAHTQRRIGALPLSARPFALRADCGCLDHAAGKGWLAVGDAAASLDPLSGSGISKALGSGLRAADAISDLLRGSSTAARDYSLYNAERFARHDLERRRVYDAEPRFREAPFWKRRRSQAA